MNNDKICQLIRACDEKELSAMMAVLNCLDNSHAHLDTLLSLTADNLIKGNTEKSLLLFNKVLSIKIPLAEKLQQLFENELQDCDLAAKELLLNETVKAQTDYGQLLALGLLYRDCELFVLAEQLFLHLIEKSPEDIRAFHRLISVYIRMQRFHEAIACCQLALEINPSSLTAHYNLGVANQSVNRDEEALSNFARALDIDPDNQWAQINISHVLLKQGYFDEGWKRFEWRKAFYEKKSNDLASVYCEWSGQSLQGKSILLWADQGLGDIIMYSGFNRSIEGIVNLQGQTFDTQNQIATGRRILSPADDPVASARIVQINLEQSQLEQFISNADAVENRLSLEEAQLQAASTIAVRIRELTIQAGGLGVTSIDRESLAAEIDIRLDEVVNLANTRDTNGEYIFSGHKGSVKPFEQAITGEYIYLGDDGQREITIATSTTVPISDSGKDIFVDIPSAVSTLDTSIGLSAGATISAATITDRTNYDANANYPEDYVVRFTGPATFDLLTRTDFIDGAPDTPVATGMPFVSGATIDFNSGVAPAPIPPLGFELTITGAPAIGDTFFVDTNQTQSFMTTLGLLSEGLKNLTDSQADRVLLEELVANTLTNLDNTESNLSQVKADIGARQNTLDSVRELNQDVLFVNKEVLSEIRDLDYAEAISRLSLETFTLEAAQQSFSRVSNLSLFNFL